MDIFCCIICWLLNLNASSIVNVGSSYTFCNKKLQNIGAVTLEYKTENYNTNMSSTVVMCNAFDACMVIGQTRD